MSASGVDNAVESGELLSGGTSARGGSALDALARRRALELGVPFVDLDDVILDSALLDQVPIELMVRHTFIPLSRRDDESATLVVALADPADMGAVDALEGLLDAPVQVNAAAPNAVERALRRAGAGERILASVTQRFEPDARTQADAEDDEGLTLASLATDASHPIIRLVDSALLNALQRRASDIHIETRDHSVWIKYRVDGVLYQALDPIELRHHDAIISRIKVMSDLDIAEKRVPQDGRFKLNLQGRRVDFRVSIMPSIHGEDAVIRILDKGYLSEEFTELRLDSLGFTESQLRNARKYSREPYGMFLVTGPTGSGKTTTLYACLSEIRSEEEKIITIGGSRGVSAARNHTDSCQRKEGPHLCSRAEVGAATRSRHHHGRRDPRPPRRPISAVQSALTGAPCLHHGAR